MTALLRWPALAALVIGVTVSGSALAQPSEAEAPPFRVEWSASDASADGVRLQGYVYNDSRYLVTNVLLRVVALDDGGRAVGETFSWVFGDVAAGGRTDFLVASTPPGTTYRVTVVWFDRVAVSRP
jgi:hypothetical protein